MATKDKSKEEEVTQDGVDSLDAVLNSDTEEKVIRDVCFRLFDITKYKTRIGRDENNLPIDIVGELSIITVRANDPNYEKKVSYLRGNANNRANGGTKYSEITQDVELHLGSDCILDELITLDNRSLLKIISEQEDTDRFCTKGKLIMKILGEQGFLK